MWEIRNIYKILVGQRKWKIPLGRRCRWKDKIKVDFKEVGCDNEDWIKLAHGRAQWWILGNTEMSLWVQ
jgi:hypothetical protein